MLSAFARDAAHFREKAAMCLRLAQGLSQNNPARLQLLALAEDFDYRAQELEEVEPSLAAEPSE
jgi:hypothetical protein